MPWTPRVQNPDVQPMGAVGVDSRPVPGAGIARSSFGPPGAALGPLAGVAFRGNDPAGYLQGMLPDAGPGRGDAYPGAGAPGSNEARPSADPKYSAAIDARSDGYFKTDNSSEKVPADGLSAQLPAPAPMPAPPRGAPPRGPARPPMRRPGVPGAPPAPAPAPVSAPKPYLEQPATPAVMPPQPPRTTVPAPTAPPAPAAPPAAAPPTGGMTVQGGVSAPGYVWNQQTGKFEPPAAAPTTKTTTSAAAPPPATTKSMKVADATTKELQTSQSFRWNGKDYTLDKLPDMDKFRAGTPAQQKQYLENHSVTPTPAAPGPEGAGPTPGQTEDSIAQGAVYDYQHAANPPKASDYWGKDAKNAPDFPPFEFDAEKGTGAFTNDGKPLIINTAAIPADTILKIPSTKKGYDAVMRAMNAAQNAAALLAEADKEPDADRRAGIISKNAAELQKHSAMLERYGIYYRPFSAEPLPQTPGQPPADPYAPPDTNMDSGLVLDKGIVQSFKDLNSAGVPKEAFGPALEIQQRKNELEQYLKDRSQAFDLGKISLDELVNDPMRAEYERIAKGIAENPDPLGAEGNAVMRGHTIEKADAALLEGDQGLSRLAASRGLDPMTFAGTSYAGGLENRRGLRNDLADQEVEAALRKRVGEQDALNALTGGSKYLGAEIGQRSDLERILMNQGPLGQNAYQGLGDFSTGFFGAQEAKKAQEDAQDLADAQRKAGLYQAGGQLAGAALAAFI